MTQRAFCLSKLNIYIDGITLSAISGSRMKNKERVEDKADFKRLAGQMLWFTSLTRPDLRYEECVMSNIGKEPKDVKYSLRLLMHFPN